MARDMPIARAAAVAGLLSGVPSTVHALLTGRDPLAAARAAGTLLLPASARPRRLLGAGLVAHTLLSLFWSVVLVVWLHRQRESSRMAAVVRGGAAGAGIAALDLGLLGRFFPAVAALPAGPQWADHVAFGAVVGAVSGSHPAQGPRPG